MIIILFSFNNIYNLLEIKMEKTNQITIGEELNNIKKDIIILKKKLLSKNLNKKINNNSIKPSIEVYTINKDENISLKKKLEDDDDQLIKKFDENNLLNEHRKLLQESIDFLEYKKKGYITIMKMKVREKNIKDRSIKYKNKYNHTYKIPYKLLSEKINEYTKIKNENDILFQDIKDKFPQISDIDDIYCNKKPKIN